MIGPGPHGLWSVSTTCSVAVYPLDHPWPPGGTAIVTLPPPTVMVGIGGNGQGDGGGVGGLAVHDCGYGDTHMADAVGVPFGVPPK